MLSRYQLFQRNHLSILYEHTDRIMVNSNSAAHFPEIKDVNNLWGKCGVPRLANTQGNIEPFISPLCESSRQR